MIIGTLANYDSKSNRNFKKAIGLQCSEQTNNSAHALCFFANFFVITAHEWPNRLFS